MRFCAAAVDTRFLAVIGGEMDGEVMMVMMMIIGGDDSDEIDYCGRFGNGGGLTQLTGRCWTP